MHTPQRVHWLQHAEHEDSGCIEPWLKSRGHSMSHTRLFAGEKPPPVSELDWLIVMGGPMNIYEHDRYPWLSLEKKFINDAIVNKSKIIGVCLGSQLVADALGGVVTKNKYQEIGWFKTILDYEADNSLIGSSQDFMAFHWHGDTYALPPGALRLAYSEACAQQAFAWGDRVLGLQFHLEVTAANAREWLRVDPPNPDRYVQSADYILADESRFAANNRQMCRILEKFEGL